MQPEQGDAEGRRFLILAALNATLTWQLSACGGGGTSTEPSNQSPPPAPVPPPPPPPPPPASQAPTAHAGAAQGVAAPATVQLDGTSSRTAAGTGVSAYSWTLANRPPGSLAKLSSSTSSRPTFKADEAGTYDLSLTVSDGTQQSLPSTVLITSTPGTWSETTIVFRVVATSPPPDWGQEPVPGWPGAAPTKDAPNYRLYDVEIARSASSEPIRLSVLKFQNWDFSKSWSASEFAEYRASSTIYSKALNGSSSDLLMALNASIDKVMQRETATRFVIEYSGHGAPWVFFENTLTMSDARSFLQYTRSAIANAVLVLDFSTNCEVGYFDFVANFYDTADYLVASDLSVGGFDPGDVTNWLKFQHDRNLQTFFATDTSHVSAMKSMSNARQNIWNNAQSSIAALKVQQSLSVYNLSEFLPLMRALKSLPTFNPLTDIPRFSSNLATYIYGTKNMALIAALEQFQFLYVSNRNLFTWKSDEQGFAVSDPRALENFLKNIT